MVQLQGDWFDGKTSAQLQVRMHVDEQGRVQLFNQADGELLLQLEFSQLDISSRVGDTPRYIYFPQGQKLETRDQQSVDALLAAHQPSLFNTLAHRLESHLQFVLLTLVLVIGLGWWSVQYGLPLAAKAIANALPANVLNMAADETLQILDKTHFEPSALDEPTRARLAQAFAPAIAEYPELQIKVQFRAGGDIGANAFALPDGTVVFTDEMVQLAQNDNELLAVLAHEIGHVKYRHALRSTIQGSVLAFAVSMLTGDLSAAGNLLATLPVLLTTMAYSRDFEREADHNALVFLDEHHIPRSAFADLMERLTYKAHCDALIVKAELFSSKASEPSAPKSVAVQDDSSTNPPPAEPGAQTDEATINAADNAATSVGAATSAASVSAVDPATPTTSVEAAQVAAPQPISPERKARCDKLIAEDKAKGTKLLDFFATHPATDERLKAFRD